MPRNVFIELGIAIALNRPILLLRHTENREDSTLLPECLKSISSHILEFSRGPTLEEILRHHLSQWINTPPKRDWWNRYCIFGDRVCEYREAHPFINNLRKGKLRCHVSDGCDVDRPDFRKVVKEVLRRFNDVTFEHLIEQPTNEGYDFRLCTYCQMVRSTPFAIYRITPHTPADTFIAIGLSLALEKQFSYRFLKYC